MFASAICLPHAAFRSFVRLVWIAPAIALVAAAPGQSDPASPGQDSMTGATEAVAASVTPPPARPQWHRRLAGIVITPQLRAAMFAPAGGTSAVQLGQQIDGWTLTEIRPDGVTIESAGETMLLTPRGLAPGTAPPAPIPLSYEQAQKTRTVSAALREQQRQQETGEAVLTEATRQMLAR
jgi:hypothetical protein